ncbi:MAG: hypothetical protein QF842_02880 [Candidatus Marinimicrobia bacterium]|mgnify:CR=1 FL=1|nr:hypothetical protein [Candidatus Neomarinimicrobiota bacterium]MDP6611129.1 hypothetical protein [Candidatus Neomarinimicrobiota bacterium]
MKTILLSIIFGIFFIGGPSGYEKDVESLDSIIKALYDVISGEKGEARDWDRFRYLFHDSGTLRSVGETKEGLVDTRAMTPEDYIKRAEPFLVGNGFFEREIGRRTEQYRHITHVFSTYDSRHSASDKKPFARGINSIQLMHDNDRWWIISILWNGETKEEPLPQKYLRMKK